MSQSGYGTTLSGTSLGSLTGIKDIRVGGIEVTVAEVATLGDTNRIPENLPTKVRDGAMELTFVYTKTVYDKLRVAAIARTEDTFTLSDVEASAHAGLGFVTRCGDLGFDTEGDQTFSVTLTPKTSWAFTASS